jgi:hypothetical protein
MAVPPPNTPFYRKIAAIERHYGMDKLSDKLLMKIARHKVPHLPAERWAAVLIIWCHKLPIPVPTERTTKTDEGDTK